MKDVLFALPGIALTILCWGAYGPLLHNGQSLLGDRLKPLMCVGFAYFVFAIILPVILLSSTGKLAAGWNPKGVSWAVAAGAAGAIGALGIVMALGSGGKPIYVMPLVFGGAPIINVLVSMYLQGLGSKDFGRWMPLFLAGVIMVAVGAAFVLVAAPKAAPHRITTPSNPAPSNPDPGSPHV
jgi:hypothetical protein